MKLIGFILVIIILAIAIMAGPCRAQTTISYEQYESHVPLQAQRKYCFDSFANRIRAGTKNLGTDSDRLKPIISFILDSAIIVGPHPGDGGYSAPAGRKHYYFFCVVLPEESGSMESQSLNVGNRYPRFKYEDNVLMYPADPPADFTTEWYAARTSIEAYAAYTYMLRPYDARGTVEFLLAKIEAIEFQYLVIQGFEGSAYNKRMDTVARKIASVLTADQDVLVMPHALEDYESDWPSKYEAESEEEQRYRSQVRYLGACLLAYRRLYPDIRERQQAQVHFLQMYCSEVKKEQN